MTKLLAMFFCLRCKGSHPTRYCPGVSPQPEEKP